MTECVDKKEDCAPLCDMEEEITSEPPKETEEKKFQQSFLPPDKSSPPVRCGMELVFINKYKDTHLLSPEEIEKIRQAVKEQMTNCGFNEENCKPDVDVFDAEDQALHLAWEWKTKDLCDQFLQFIRIALFVLLEQVEKMGLLMEVRDKLF